MVVIFIVINKIEGGVEFVGNVMSFVLIGLSFRCFLGI